MSAQDSHNSAGSGTNEIQRYLLDQQGKKIEKAKCTLEAIIAAGDVEIDQIGGDARAKLKELNLIRQWNDRYQNGRNIGGAIANGIASALTLENADLAIIDDTTVDRLEQYCNWLQSREFSETLYPKESREILALLNRVTLRTLETRTPDYVYQIDEGRMLIDSIYHHGLENKKILNFLVTGNVRPTPQDTEQLETRIRRKIRSGFVAVIELYKQGKIAIRSEELRKQIEGWIAQLERTDEDAKLNEFAISVITRIYASVNIEHLRR